MFIFPRPLVAPLLGLITAAMLVLLDEWFDVGAIVQNLCVFSGGPCP